ncbi:MAG: hypothetical protein ACE5FT_05000 [Candidatus Nanoarchaeia archaeon]
MAKTRIQDYVKKRRGEGYTTEEIRTVLHKAGYATNEINKVLGRGKGLGSAVIVILVILAVAAAGYWMFTAEPEVVVEEVSREPVYDVPRILEFEASKCQKNRVDHTCLAIAQGDSTICEQNLRYADKQECYLDYLFAYLTGTRSKTDEGLCDKIPDSVLRDTCVAVRKGEGLGDIEGCRRLGNADESAYCEAFVLSDASKCANIQNENLKRACADTVTLYRAVQANDVNICNEIQKDETKLQCQARLTGDTNLCGDIIDLYCVEESKIRVAEITGNPYVCEQIRIGKTGDDNLKERCYLAAALKGKDPSKCAGLDYPYDLACKGVLTETSAHCGNIPVTNFGTFTEMRDSCFTSVAVAKGDAALCEFVTSPEIKATCEAMGQHIFIEE